MQDSYIQLDKRNRITTYAGPDAIMLASAIVLRAAIKLYQTSKVIPTRGMTISMMLARATQITGKSYTTRQYDAALSDLGRWIETMRSAMPIKPTR